MRRKRRKKPFLLRFCTLQAVWMGIVLLMALALAIQTLGIAVTKRIPSARLPGAEGFAGEQRGAASQPCAPKTHVMFLKTHKTASSTVLNLLYRFGEARNLSVALPRGYQFGYPMPFNSRRIKLYNSFRHQVYHIMCNHMRFYRPQVEKVMPRGTFYFSILRNPVTLAESAFTYYKGSSSAFSKVQRLEQFYRDPWRYYSVSETGSHYARNLMWFDFGHDHNANVTEHYVAAVLKEIEETFHLVLLAEYFDQSMVLLRQALCWDLDDLVTFKLNLRSNKTVSRLSTETMGQIRAWNALDWSLYLHFNRTFWQRVDRYGQERMRRDVQILREKRQEMMELCLQGGQPVEAAQIQDKNIKPFQYGRAKIMGYNLKPSLNNHTRERCVRMVMPELQYKDLLATRPSYSHVQRLVVNLGARSNQTESSRNGVTQGSH